MMFLKKYVTLHFKNKLSESKYMYDVVRDTCLHDHYQQPFLDRENLVHQALIASPDPSLLWCLSAACWYSVFWGHCCHWFHDPLIFEEEGFVYIQRGPPWFVINLFRNVTMVLQMVLKKDKGKSIGKFYQVYLSYGMLGCFQDCLHHVRFHIMKIRKIGPETSS